MVRTVVVACIAVALTGLAAAQDPDSPLDKARKAHAAAVDKAKQALSDNIGTAIQKATASGSLDVVKALQAEREAFEGSGKLPTSPRTKVFVAEYQQSTKVAAGALEKAYDQVVKDLTKAMKFAEAEAVQAQLKEFRTKTPGLGLRPTDVTTKDDLQKYLGGTSWVWGNITLKADGTVECKEWEGLVTRWEAVDRRTVVFWIEKGRTENRYAILLFAEDLSEFRGYDFNGKDRLTAVKRKP